MTIDVNELHYGFTDMKPIDMDWTEGWTETWEFTDADEVQVPVAELTDLVCSDCEEPVAFINGVLTHTTATCLHCSEPITEDDNGAGGKVWVHDFGSTVCYDDPPGSHEAGDTTTTAEPEDYDHDAELELEDNVRFVSADEDSANFLVAGSSPHVEVEALNTSVYIGDGPMMSYWYPCQIDDTTEAAFTLAEHSLPLCVVEVDGETGLALTGGGMDLSWEICMAYMVLGYLPPLHYADLPGMAGKRATPYNLAVIAACKRSAEGMIEQANRTIRRLSEMESNLVPLEAS